MKNNLKIRIIFLFIAIGFFSIWYFQNKYKIINSKIEPYIISLILFFLLITVIKFHDENMKIMNEVILDIAGITSTMTVFNVKTPGADIIIDMVTIHPTGIYLINKIPYEGHISGTIMMDYWEVEKKGKPYNIKNPIQEMKKNRQIFESMFTEPVYPVIIFKNKANCYTMDGWLDKSMLLIKEYEQEKIFKDKEYCISYIRSEDIFENMKQFQTKKRRKK